MKNIKSFIKDYFFISLGSCILALSLNMFLAPNKTSGGGVGTIATILWHLFNVKMSISNLMCNAILFIFGYKVLGKYAVVKTISGIVALSTFLELTSYLPTYTEDIIVATIIGGILMGIGVGCVVRYGASTGGSDFAALIVKRVFPHLSISIIILIIDTIIIAISGIVFRNFTITVYSVTALYISSVVTDSIVAMGDAAKGVQVISNQYEEIANNIMSVLERGVTGINCTGMYTNYDRKMLYCVVNPKELPKVIKIIKNIDKDAFIIVSDVREVLGEGFKINTIYDDEQSNVDSIPEQSNVCSGK